MIDPTNITKFDRTEAELEEFLLFCILVAGKNSNVQAKKLEQFLDSPNYHFNKGVSPFEKIVSWILIDRLDVRMKFVKLGQYTRLGKCFTQLVSLQGKLKYCSVFDLEKIHGIGPKTARFFLTHTHPNQQFAILDTHMLRYLRDNGYNAPKSTPSAGPTYRMWEFAVLQEARKALMSAADFDLMVWNKYSKNGNNHLDKSSTTATVIS